MAVKVLEAGTKPELVRVWGREDVGEIIDPGRVIGHAFRILCVGVHFPETGEVAYFDITRVTPVAA
jgi:hypothetical protein